MIEIDLVVPSGVTLASVDVFEDDTTVVVAAFALWPPSVKLPGVPMVTRRVELNVPLGERELRDAGQAWRPKPGAGPPVRGRCPGQHR